MIGLTRIARRAGIAHATARPWPAARWSRRTSARRSARRRRGSLPAIARATASPPASPMRMPMRDQQHAVAHDQQEHAARAGAERQADAHLARAARDRKRQHAVDADAASSSARPPNTAEQPRAHPRRIERRADRLGHRLDVRHRQVGLERLDLAPQARLPATPAAPTRARRASCRSRGSARAAGRRPAPPPSASVPYLLSRTTPTISRHGPSGPSTLTRWPIGFSSGKCIVAVVSLTMTTGGGGRRRPASPKSRPVSSGMPSVLKKRGPTTLALITVRVVG